MPFPLSSPSDILSRLQARTETELRKVRPDISEAALSRAVRSPRGMIAALLRVMAMELYEVHLHLRWWGDQYFPDTAEEAALIRHCSIWGIIRRPATRAVGRAVIAGTDGTTILAATRFTGATAIYQTTGAATISGGTATLDLIAVDAGADGNAEAGTKLSLESPVAGITYPVATVDSGAFAGGAEIETLAALLGRLLDRIQAPPHGGAAADYRVWVQNSFPALDATALPNWLGLGTVGVPIVMGEATAPRAPNDSEIAAIAAMLSIARPVTAGVTVFAAPLLPVPMTIGVYPDSSGVRSAVDTAVTAFFATEARIGARIARSRLSEAISAANGEYRHDLMVPAADVVPAVQTFPVRGAITWAAPS